MNRARNSKTTKKKTEGKATSKLPLMTKQSKSKIKNLLELQPVCESLKSPIQSEKVDDLIMNELIEHVGLDKYQNNEENDDFSNKSVSSGYPENDLLMVPQLLQQPKNFTVVSTSTDLCLRNQNLGKDSLANFNSSIGPSCTMALEQSTSWIWGLVKSPERIPYAIFLLLGLVLFFPWTMALFIGLIVYFLMGTGGTKPSKRTIKWGIQDFSEELKGGFITSPQFLDKSGQWRLVVRQKNCMDGIQTMFGLIATDIPKEVEFVSASIIFSCTNSLGHEISPGMKGFKFCHKFECSGDCGYTRPIMFSRRQLGDDDTLNINCKINFKRIEIPYLKQLFLNYKRESKDGLVKVTKGKNSVVETGTVQPENFVYQNKVSVMMQPIARFIQHEETKTFLWEIPSFEMLMQNTECWGLFSPQFFVNSHDFCSIWRMKLLEVQGVFRLHVQLRGLPRSIKQIKMWYLLQLVDNFGDTVIPEHSICRVRYPDHLNLWDTTRHILYRRETLVDRFLSPHGTLTLRLSLHLEPNDLPLLEADSDEWICPN